MWVNRLLALALIVAPLSAGAQEHSAAPAITHASNADAATRAWLSTVSPQDKARSDAYFEGGYWLILWNFLLTTAIMLALLCTRTSARIRDLTTRVARSQRLQVALYALAFVAITALLSLPLEYYQHFVREHQYGMSTQSFGSWIGDWLKGIMVELISVPLLLVALYGVFRRAPRSWWILGSLVVIIFFVLGALIAPVYIEPLFNKYTPLEDPRIRDPILQLARANQVPVDKVFVVDASRQTNRVSANVSGFLNTARIALNDNLLRQCSLPEIREVMAHEMGHYVLNHTIKYFAFVTLLALVAFGLARLIFEWAVRHWGKVWAVRDIADPAGLPLLVLILALLAFLGTPINNTLVRTQEREADAFALNAAREPDATALVALKLGKYRKMQPTPLEEAIFFDHPSGRSRIRMAMDWKYASLPAGGASFSPKQ